MFDDLQQASWERFMRMRAAFLMYAGDRGGLLGENRNEMLSSLIPIKLDSRICEHIPLN